MAAQYHFGVYARIRTAGHILLVRKTRGPYAGLLDLPGGRPEPGESWTQALERELDEELGIRVSVTGRFTRFNLHVAQSSSGASIDFHHHGAFADLPPVAPQPVHSPDTAGFEWYDLTTGDPTRLSTLAREVNRA